MTSIELQLGKAASVQIFTVMALKVTHEAASVFIGIGLMAFLVLIGTAQVIGALRSDPGGRGGPSPTATAPKGHRARWRRPPRHEDKTY